MRSNNVQKIIEAALTEQVLECYTALNKTLSEKLVPKINQISESVSKSYFEGYEDRREGEKKSSPMKSKAPSKKLAMKESYNAQVPEVQRAIDFVVEGVAKKGTSAFASLVEAAESKFGIYNEDLKNYFANAIKEEFETQPAKSIVAHLKGKPSTKGLVDKYFGPKPKKSAARKAAAKRLRGR